MSSIPKIFSLVIALILSYCNSNAQHFASSLLKQSAETLQLHGLIDLPSGYSTLNVSGTQLCVIKHEDRIDHIGRPIFPLQLREKNPLPIYDYLEFAWLEQSMLHLENPNKYKEVIFETGDWNILKNVSKETPCSVSIEDDSRYHLVWTFANGKELSINVPVNYEIISTATRGELEQNLISDLRKHRATTNANNNLDPQSLKELRAGLYVLEGDCYILPSINNSTYYSRVDNWNYKLICDTTQMSVTLANLFCASDVIGQDWSIHIIFNLHESRQDTLSMSVIDFADYLRTSGCIVFWGDEGNLDGVIDGSVFAYCSAGGYNHIFKVTYKPENDRHLSCKASLYVPTTNIRDLHMQYNPKKDNEKIKWQ